MIAKVRRLVWSVEMARTLFSGEELYVGNLVSNVEGEAPVAFGCHAKNRALPRRQRSITLLCPFAQNGISDSATNTRPTPATKPPAMRMLAMALSVKSANPWTAKPTPTAIAYWITAKPSE